MKKDKVNWMEWSREAFELAKKEKKPVLLNITATWCHWCHQMSRHNYENEDVAKIINAYFIPVRVDTDRRPDINERYNQGGWPTTVFLDSKGNIILGSTYVHPQEFPQMLEYIKNFYEKNADSIPQMTQAERPQGTDFSDVPDQISQRIEEDFYIDFGGFGRCQKFPMPDVLEFCMTRYFITKEKKFRLFVTTTLDNMTGIMDKVEGGFFRYSTDKQWSVPHFEKMLEGNAEIIASYVHAYAMTGKTEYAKIAEKTIEYVMKNLMGEAFYSSQDASEEYYNSSDRKEKPIVDKTIYVNFNAKMVNALLEASIFIDIKYKQAALKVLDFLAGLWTERGFCHYAGGEYGLLCDNVQMSKTLLNAYEITADAKYLDFARKVMEFVRNNFMDGTSLNDRIHEKGDIGMLAMHNRNLAENAAAAECFARLAFYTDDDGKKDLAEKILEDMAGMYKMYGVLAAPYGLAIDRLLHGIQVKSQCTKAEYESMQKIFNPLKMMKFGGEGEFTIGICKGAVCLMPAKNLDALRKVLES